MSKISKYAGATAAIVAIAAVSAFAYAQSGPGGGHGRMGMGHGQEHGMKGKGQGRGMGQHGDPAAHLATLKTDLAIKPEQTAAWDAYAKVVTDTAAEHRKIRDGIDRDAMRKMEQKDREAFRESMQKSREGDHAKVKAAAETLLTQLDDTQKAKAQQSLPGLIAMGGPGGRHGMRGGHGMGGGMGGGMGPGKGPNVQR